MKKSECNKEVDFLRKTLKLSHKKALQEWRDRQMFINEAKRIGYMKGMLIGALELKQENKLDKEQEKALEEMQEEFIPIIEDYYLYGIKLECLLSGKPFSLEEAKKEIFEKLRENKVV
jgi:predicted butyrate kinase (DUF1464 family)